MKQFQIMMFMFMVVCCNHVFYGQNTIYSTLTKNINTKASGLSHNLNAAGDSLMLKSEFVLSKIEIINDVNVQVIPFPNEAREVAVPLNKLDVGDYTISVFFIEGKDDTYIYSKTVVFKIERLLPIMEFSAFNLALNNSSRLENDQILMPENLDKVISEVSLKTNDVISDFSRTNLTSTNRESLKNLVPPGEISFDSKKVRSENKFLATSIKAEDAVADTGETIFVPYSLSDARRFIDDPRYVIQTREAYRKENLRPNGKPYN